MKVRLCIQCSVVALSMLVFAGDNARAAGKLHVFNWGNNTSPELLRKFESQYDVAVTVTDYASSDIALSKVRAGGHGFDIAVIGSNYIPIWIEEGLLMDAGVNQLGNFKNVQERWTDVEWDPKRKYSVPWLWGTTGITVDTSIYSGDINTSALFLDPPDELKGRINIVPETSEIIALTILYLGGEVCSKDLSLLRRVRDKLNAAKTSWISVDYGTPELYAKGDFAAGVNWSGDSLRARLLKPSIRFGYPREGFIIWMDSAAILKDAKNVTNAKLFLDFILLPENAALNASFAKNASGVKGVEEYLPDEMKTAPEVNIPPEVLRNGVFLPACPPDVMELYAKIWTEIQR